MACPIIGGIVFLGVVAIFAFLGDTLARGINEFFDNSP